MNSLVFGPMPNFLRMFCGMTTLMVSISFSLAVTAKTQSKISALDNLNSFAYLKTSTGALVWQHRSLVQHSILQRPFQLPQYVTRRRQLTPVFLAPAEEVTPYLYRPNAKSASKTIQGLYEPNRLYWIYQAPG